MRPLPLDVRIATGRPMLTAAYELVYRIYLGKGYIAPSPGRIVYQQVFGLPTSRTIVATDAADEVMGTLTVVGDNDLGLTIERAFAEQVGGLRDRRRRIAEITSLAVESAAPFPKRAVFFALTQFAMNYGFHQQYDDMLMAIHPRHYRYYWHVFRAVPLGPCRPHPAVQGHPAICASIHAHDLKQNMAEEIRRQYFSVPVQPHRFAGPPIGSADHAHFCRRAGIAWDDDSQGCDAAIRRAA